jgi:hypothetical protein
LLEERLREPAIGVVEELLGDPFGGTHLALLLLIGLGRHDCKCQEYQQQYQ